MATFALISKKSAPPPPPAPSSLAKRMAEFDGYVKALRAGQVGRLKPAERETTRGLTMRIGRAATRLGKSVNTWTVDGVVYLQLG